MAQSGRDEQLGGTVVLEVAMLVIVVVVSACSFASGSRFKISHLVWFERERWMGIS